MLNVLKIYFRHKHFFCKKKAFKSGMNDENIFLRHWEGGWCHRGRALVDNTVRDFNGLANPLPRLLVRTQGYIYIYIYIYIYVGSYTYGHWRGSRAECAIERAEVYLSVQNNRPGMTGEVTALAMNGEEQQA